MPLLLGNQPAKAKREKTEKAGHKGKRASSKKQDIIPKNIMDSIPYCMVYDNGIIETTPGVFTKSYMLPEINFRLAKNESQDAIARMYGEFLGVFEPEIQIEVTVYNRSVSMEEFMQEILLEMQADGLDSYREEYNDMLLEKMIAAKNNLVAKKYLTISAPADDIRDAIAVFSQIDATVAERLAHLVNRDVTPMDTISRLNLLSEIYNQDPSPIYKKQRIQGHEVESFSLENCARQGITTKEVIAPSVMNFTKPEIVLGESVAKSYYVANYPTWLKASVLSDFEILPANFLLSIHFNSIAKDESAKMIKEKSMAIRGIIYKQQKDSLKHGVIPNAIQSPVMNEAMQEIDNLRSDVTKEDERIFTVTTILTLFADDKDNLKKIEKQAIRIANQNLMTIRPLSGTQQEPGFNSSLPLAVCQLQIDRMMQTDSVSALIPFNMKEIRQPDGRYYGLNAVSKNMILYDRATGPNPAAIILGVPGAGKSFSAKREMINVLLSTPDVIYCIDPQGEYNPIVNAMGGICQQFAEGADFFINPLDINLNTGFEGKIPLTVKTDYVMGLCNIIVGGQQGLSPIEKTVITRACKYVYEDFIKYLERTGKDYDYEKNPTLRDLYEELLHMPEPEAQTIALSMERFVDGTYALFSHHTNVNIDNRFINYDLRNVGTGLEELGLYTAFGYVYNRMMVNATLGIRTWLYIDEFYVLMNNQTSATYISDIWKQARKWNGYPTAITQNIEDMLRSNEARTVINNSYFKILLGQSDINRKELSKLLSISPMEQKYISRAKPGMGLLQIGEDFVPFDDNFPRNTKLYKIMSTNPNEDLSNIS